MAATAPPGSHPELLPPFASLTHEIVEAPPVVTQPGLAAYAPVLGKVALNPLGTLEEIERVRLELRRAYQRINNCDARDLPTIPGVDSISFQIRLIPNGRNWFIQGVQYTAMEGDPLAWKWLQLYLAVSPADREKLSLDDITAMADIRPSKLLGAMVQTLMQRGLDASHLVRAFLGPEVQRMQLESAQRITGDDKVVAQVDRRDFLQSIGMAPAPARGGGVTLNVQGGNAVAASQANAVAAAKAEAPSVPSFLSDMQALAAPVKAVQAQLTAAPVAQQPPWQRPPADLVGVLVGGDDDLDGL